MQGMLVIIVLEGDKVPGGGMSPKSGESAVPPLLPENRRPNSCRVKTTDMLAAPLWRLAAYREVYKHPRRIRRDDEAGVVQEFPRTAKTWAGRVDENVDDFRTASWMATVGTSEIL